MDIASIIGLILGLIPEVFSGEGLAKRNPTTWNLFIRAIAHAPQLHGWFSAPFKARFRRAAEMYRILKSSGKLDKFLKDNRFDFDLGQTLRDFLNEPRNADLRKLVYPYVSEPPSTQFKLEAKEPYSKAISPPEFEEIKEPSKPGVFPELEEYAPIIMQIKHPSRDPVEEVVEYVIKLTFDLVDQGDIPKAYEPIRDYLTFFLYDAYGISPFLIDRVLETLIKELEKYKVPKDLEKIKIRILEYLKGKLALLEKINEV